MSSAHNLHDEMMAAANAFANLIEDPGAGNLIRVERVGGLLILEGAGNRTLPPASWFPNGAWFFVHNKHTDTITLDGWNETTEDFLADEIAIVMAVTNNSGDKTWMIAASSPAVSNVDEKVKVDSADAATGYLWTAFTSFDGPSGTALDSPNAWKPAVNVIQPGAAGTTLSFYADDQKVRIDGSHDDVSGTAPGYLTDCFSGFMGAGDYMTGNDQTVYIDQPSGAGEALRLYTAIVSPPADLDEKVKVDASATAYYLDDCWDASMDGTPFTSAHQVVYADIVAGAQRLYTDKATETDALVKVADAAETHKLLDDCWDATMDVAYNASNHQLVFKDVTSSGADSVQRLYTTATSVPAPSVVVHTTEGGTLTVVHNGVIVFDTGTTRVLPAAVTPGNSIYLQNRHSSAITTTITGGALFNGGPNTTLELDEHETAHLMVLYDSSEAVQWFMVSGTGSLIA